VLCRGDRADIGTAPPPPQHTLSLSQEAVLVDDEEPAEDACPGDAVADGPTLNDFMVRGVRSFSPPPNNPHPPSTRTRPCQPPATHVAAPCPVLPSLLAGRMRAAALTSCVRPHIHISQHSRSVRTGPARRRTPRPGGRSTRFDNFDIILIILCHASSQPYHPTLAVWYA